MRCARNDCRRWRPDVLVRHARTGVVFDGAWYCSTPCLRAAVERRLVRLQRARVRLSPVQPLKLGMVLRHQGGLTADEIEAALAHQRRTGLRLGTQLVILGWATSDDVLRALASQGRVGYLTTLNLAPVRQGPGGLSREAVRALGLVPFDLDRDRQRMKVACVAPVPRQGLTALREVTGWEAGAFLVADDQWPLLVDSYGAARLNGTFRSRTVAAIEDAVDDIVEAAAGGAARSMAAANCDRGIWVRLAGNDTTSDLVLSVEPRTTGERSLCQAAPTLH